MRHKKFRLFTYKYASDDFKTYENIITMSPLACWSEPILINKINNITKRTKMD